MNHFRTTALAAKIILITTMICGSEGAWQPEASRSDSGRKLPARVPDLIPVHAAQRGIPWINLNDGYSLSAAYTRGILSADSLAEMRPLSLASGDFDEDGIPDLVCGYVGPRGGVLLLYRGNVDSIYPETPGARQCKAEGMFTDAPFVLPASAFDSPVAPVFLGVGDLDADGRRHLIAADGSNSRLYWMRGDGKGRGARLEPVPPPGVVTAFATGEFNQHDGLTDLAIAVGGPKGPAILILQSTEGALISGPEILTLASRANSLTTGQLDDQAPFDLAVAAGSELLIVSGRDRA